MLESYVCYVLDCFPLDSSGIMAKIISVIHGRLSLSAQLFSQSHTINIPFTLPTAKSYFLHWHFPLLLRYWNVEFEEIIIDRCLNQSYIFLLESLRLFDSEESAGINSQCMIQGFWVLNPVPADRRLLFSFLESEIRHIQFCPPDSSWDEW